MSNRYYEDDEKPFIKECEQLLNTLKPGFRNAFCLFARYSGSYERFKSVRNFFDEFVKEGLATTNKTLSVKGKCLYRSMCHEAMEVVRVK